MRDCFILGCGRSGTSLTAGLLSEAGYFMGDELYPPDAGNPRGYFEAREVNGINEGLLAQLVPAPRRGLADRLLGRPKPEAGWFRWLAELAPTETVSCSPRLAERIKRQTAHRPFCLKDPRFCYTLAVWRRFAPEAAMICVFRHPQASAQSIVAEAARDDVRVDGERVDYARAIRVWRAMYTHVLESRQAGGDWLFVNYEQLLSGKAADEIERLLGATVRRDFADPALRRSPADGEMPSALATVYDELCRLARFDGRACDV
jgi:hypothetical protein